MHIQQLCSMSLSRCVGVTDAGVGLLAGLPHLSSLNLAHTCVLGRQLTSLRSLTHLDVGGCRGFSDAALHTLATSLQLLSSLALGGSGVSNTGLHVLQHLPGLCSLNLGHQFEVRRQ